MHSYNVNQRTLLSSHTFTQSRCPAHGLYNFSTADLHQRSQLAAKHQREVGLGERWKCRPSKAGMTHAAEFSRPDRLESPISTFVVISGWCPPNRKQREKKKNTTSHTVYLSELLELLQKSSNVTAPSYTEYHTRVISIGPAMKRLYAARSYQL